jgi:plastocyanin
MRRSLVMLLAVAALAGCGGDDEGDSRAEPASGGGAVVIHMKNFQFVPKDAAASVGQTVRWVNDDSSDHNAVAQSGADFRSELFGSGESYETKLDTAGTVRYECTIHPGMVGTIKVSG